jgi:hypothetical protein
MSVLKLTIIDTKQGATVTYSVHGDSTSELVVIQVENGESWK